MERLVRRRQLVMIAQGATAQGIALFGGQYDLGGGATLNGGVRRTYNLVNDDGTEADPAWIGDFGIALSF